jgi:spore coat protein CotH
MDSPLPRVHADLEFEGQALKDIAVRYKGNGTWMGSQNSLKRSLKVDLNEYVNGQKLAGLTKLNFHNNVTDASLMNEVLSHRLFRDAKVPAPRTAYARVFVTVPGKHDRKYFGLYSMIEDVDKHFADDNFGSKKGAIFKPVTPNLFAYLGDDWKKYNQTYDPKTDLTPEQKQRIIDFSRLVTSADDAEFASKLDSYLDLDEFARFMAVTVYLSTLDSILAVGQNYYVYLSPKSFKFQFIPWDLDHSFGQFSLVGNQEQRENLSIQKPWRGENRFLERVFKVESFKKLYLAKLDEFSKTIFNPERFSKQVDEIAVAIRPALTEESETKVARFNKVAAGESVGPEGFGGFGQTVKPIKGFVVVRTPSVVAQLSGKSEGQTIAEFGFGGGGGGPGGGRGFGPGMFLGGAFMSALDTDKDGWVSHDEFTQGFTKWFASWNTDKSGTLNDEQLRAGINQDLAPFRGGPPGGPGFRPPDAPPPSGQ